MRIIYMGTPDFAVDPLYALHRSGHTIACVVTQPDRPNSRRGKDVIFSPVKKAALELDIPVYQPQTVSSEESVMYLRQFDADIIVVAAYGQLLAPEILNLAPYGCINIHASLLPKYRGAAPIHRSIIEGEEKSGVTIMYMNEGLDTGDMMISEETPITESMTVGDLHDKLAQIGSDLVVRAIELLSNGNAPRLPQNDKFSSYAEKIVKSDCLIDFEQSANDVYNRIRGLNPFPGAFTYFNGKIIKLYQVKLLNECYNDTPGTMIGLEEDGIVVACESGSILIQTLKPEGKRLMRGREFWAGLQNQTERIFVTKRR